MTMTKFLNYLALVIVIMSFVVALSCILYLCPQFIGIIVVVIIIGWGFHRVGEAFD